MFPLRSELEEKREQTNQPQYVVPSSPQQDGLTFTSPSFSPHVCPVVFKVLIF